MSSQIKDVISGDQGLWDGREPITFTKVAPIETTPGGEVQWGTPQAFNLQALRKDETRKGDENQGGKRVFQEARFHIKSADIPVLPEPGDHVTCEDDSVWEITIAQLETLGTRWVLTAKFIG